MQSRCWAGDITALSARVGPQEMTTLGNGAQAHVDADRSLRRQYTYVAMHSEKHECTR